MRRFVLILAAALCLPVAAQAQWAIYPGAQRDAAAEAKAMATAHAAGVASVATVATSPDSFDKVLAFYRSRGKEYIMPRRPGQAGTGYEVEMPGGLKRGPTGVERLPSELTVMQAFFIFDGAADLAASKDWITVTRPFIGEMVPNGSKFEYRDVRDVTAIVRSKR